MELSEIKQNINLIQFARERYGIKVDDHGKGSCPFHPPDNNNSFSIFKGQDGFWRFKCFHDGETKGTIVDLVMMLDSIENREACRRLLDEFSEPLPMKAARPKLEIEREHIYLDAEGRPVFKKVKYRPNGQKVTWGFMHDEAGAWQPGKGGGELIPYGLDKFKGHDAAVVCEGEKDVDTINALGVAIFATSAPAGKGSWPDSITKYFSGFKETTFLYDVGNDEDVKKHAAKVHAALPEMKIFIAHVPGEELEFDITDYLAGQTDKSMALLDVLGRKLEFSGPQSPTFEPPAKRSLLEDLEIENDFLRSFIRSVSECTDAPEVFILFSAIGLLSGLLNKFYFFFPRRTHLNLFILLLAPSTYYRKSTCADIVSDYLGEVNRDLILPDSFTTEALFDILKKYPRGLIIWRELIQIKEFQFGSDYNKGLPSFLVDLYDSKDQYRRWTKADSEIIIENPVISILTAGIASWFVENLRKIDFEGGIWTRFLFVPAAEIERKYSLPQKFIADYSILKKLRRLDGMEPRELNLENVSPLLQTWGENHMAQTLALESNTLQAIFQRLEVMLIKLTCLLQLGHDESTEIGEPAFRDAERIIAYIKAALLPFFEEEIHFTLPEKERARLLKIIKRKNPILKSDLLRFGNIDLESAEKILRQLEASDRIKRQSIAPGKKGGRPGTLLFYVKDKNIKEVLS